MTRAPAPPPPGPRRHRRRRHRDRSGSIAGAPGRLEPRRRGRRLGEQRHPDVPGPLARPRAGCGPPLCSPVSTPTPRTSCRPPCCASYRSGRGSATTRSPTYDACSRESVTRWRGRWWRERVVDAPPEASVDGPPGDRLALLRALAQLSPRQRAVLVPRYFDDQTEAATAEALDVSLGTVKSHAREGLARLRKLAPAPKPRVALWAPSPGHSPHPVGGPHQSRGRKAGTPATPETRGRKTLDPTSTPTRVSRVPTSPGTSTVPDPPPGGGGHRRWSSHAAVTAPYAACASPRTRSAITWCRASKRGDRERLGVVDQQALAVVDVAAHHGPSVDVPAAPPGQPLEVDHAIDPGPNVRPRWRALAAERR
jgi:hypothetical protein